MSFFIRRACPASSCARASSIVGMPPSPPIPSRHPRPSTATVSGRIVLAEFLSDHHEVRHHALILVRELMTVNQVKTYAVEAHEHIHGFEVCQQDGVLPSTLPREHLSTAARARLNLERCAMDVHRMRRVAVGREAPAFHRTERNLKVDAVDVVDPAVDPRHPLEAELACGGAWAPER